MDVHSADLKGVGLPPGENGMSGFAYPINSKTLEIDSNSTPSILVYQSISVTQYSVFLEDEPQPGYNPRNLV